MACFTLSLPQYGKKAAGFLALPALPASSVTTALLWEGCGQSSSPPCPHLQVDVRIAVLTQGTSLRGSQFVCPFSLSARAGSLQHVCVSTALSFSTFSLV